MAKQNILEKTSLGKKILVLALFVVLLAVAYYFIFHRDLAKELETQKQAYGRLVEEEKEWQERKRTYMADVEELNRKKERQREQERILPPDQEMSSFLNDLDNLAGLAGLDIKLIEPASEQGAGFYAKIPVKLILSGRFHQVVKFFYSVGKLERIINIENMKFMEVSTQGADVIENAEVVATTFRSLETQTGKSGMGKPASTPAPAGRAAEEG